MLSKAILLGIIGLIVVPVSSQSTSYMNSIAALADGKIGRQKDLSGDVWFKVTGFVKDKLPYLENDIGVSSMDNVEPLRDIVELAQVAAENGKWGDLVFLYNAFSMNAFEEHVKISSEPMTLGLRMAVTGSDDGEPDASLINLYASTSSSPALAAAFNRIKKSATLGKRWDKTECGISYRASRTYCADVIQFVSQTDMIKRGGPRDVCLGDCCISWSKDATFRLSSLVNAAKHCMNFCNGPSFYISCKVFGVDLQGTLLNQCLSNRAWGCD